MTTGSFDRSGYKRLVWDGTGLILGALWWLKWVILALTVTIIAIKLLKH